MRHVAAQPPFLGGADVRTSGRSTGKPGPSYDPVLGTRPCSYPGRALSQELSEGAEQLDVSPCSRRRGRMLPSMRRLGPESPKGAAGDEVALKVERVVDGGLDRKEALG